MIDPGNEVLDPEGKKPPVADPFRYFKSFKQVAIIFLVVNVIFVLIGHGDLLNTKLYPQMNNIPFQSRLATKMVEKKIKKEHTRLEKFTIRYEDRSIVLSRAFFVLVAVFFFIPLWIVNYNKKVFIADHFLASLQFIGLVTFFAFVLLPWIFGSSKYPLILTSSALLYLFERNVYHEPVLRSLSKAALLVFLFYITLQVYRVTLFYITIWTL